MSMLEGGVSCEADLENNDKVNPDSVQTVQNTNAPSCHVEDTDDDNELLKGLLTDTFCQVCEAVLRFESQRVSHYEGKKHAQRVRIYLQTKKAERFKQSQEKGNFQSSNVNPEKFCDLCNMVFSSHVVARSHYEGKVHAKNMRKSDTTPSTDTKTSLTVAPPVPTREGAIEDEADQEQETVQEVNLSDPDKYCKLCTASFNNPVMAQQHYSGRKHQRNQARQEMLSKVSSESDNAGSLTCPVCCLTLSSIETYQAHIQSSKHFVHEKKMVGSCKTQKKMYNSFQDELADYIQVQKARGLEPKTGVGSDSCGKGEEELKESEQFEEKPEMPLPSSHRSPPLPPPPPPLPHFRPPRWRPSFQPRTGHFGFRGRFPKQHQWGQGYPPHPPPLIPGLTGRSLRKGWSPDSISSSSSSTSDSSSYSSSSSDSSSDSSRDRRRRRRKRKERMKRRRDQEDDSDKDERRRSKKRRMREGEDEQGHIKKARRERESSEEEQGIDEEKERKKRQEKRHRAGDSSEEDDYRGRRRASKKNKRQKDGHRHGKRRREENEGEPSKESVEEEVAGGDGGVQNEGVQATEMEHREERTEPKEERSKRKKEKKKVKEKMDDGDTRTEEEKLWDETILGIF